MARAVLEILELYHERRRRISAQHAAALTVQAAYYGDIVLPLTELDRSEKPLVANLLYQGGEAKAQRIASTIPDIYYPSMNPGVALRDKEARQRRLLNLAWWTDDKMKLKLRKRARHLVFYASSPVLVRPDFKEGRPTWQVRNPLSMFAPEMDVGDMVPDDAIFTYLKPSTWVSRNYPDAWLRINKKPQETTYTILEFVDENEYVLCALGEPYIPPTQTPGGYQNNQRGQVGSPDGEIVELERMANRIGRVPVVSAGRIGLEHARGEFDGVVGLWQAQAKLMALMVIGTEKAIFPEEWLVDNPNGDGANIVTHADPLHGIMGHVSGGQIVPVHPLPEAFGGNMISQLERYFRLEAAIPAQMGGEGATNVRTARQGNDLLSSAIDFAIQEEQELFEVALREENRIAIEIDRAYFPTRKSVFLSSSMGTVTYEADQLWAPGSDKQWVKYAHAGVDAQGLPVEIGQRIGMGIMSKRTAMETDPLIEDPQMEFDRMNVEMLRTGLQASLAQAAQDPTLAPMVAQITKNLTSGETEIEDAVLQLHQAMQQAQQAQQEAAAQAQPPGAEAQPGMTGAPPAIGQLAPSAQNLTALLSSLHRQQTASREVGGTGVPANLPVGAGVANG